MIQSGKFDSLKMDIKKLANSVLIFTIKRLIEIAGIIIFGLGILLLLALASYSPTDPNFIFRIPDWVIEYDSNNNASFENNIFNKYFYACGTLIEVIPPPPPQFVFNSDRCTLEGCPKLTTKTKENKNMNQRYSAAMNVDFRLASKIKFDCGNK